MTFGDHHLTYRELNTRANRLAHFLIKSGAGYVPLDPTSPSPQLAAMLEDARPVIILTQRHLADRFYQHGIWLLSLDSEWNAIESFSSRNPNRSTKDDHLACVIYSSGSTGTLMGAMNTHRGIANRLLWMQDVFHLDRSDTVLQKTPYL